MAAIDSYLEHQYNMRAAIPEHSAIFARWAERSKSTRDELSGKLDLAYGSGTDETLDLFPAQGKSERLLLFVHGGYWRALDKSDHSFVARELVRDGSSVAVMNYSLCPKVRIGDIVRQTRAAAAWLRRGCREYGADALYVAGHSAGGHLTAMLLATDWAGVASDLPREFFRGAFAISGLFDLAPLERTSINNEIQLDAAQIAALSPIRLRPTQNVEFRVSVGELESDEFKRQSREMANAWPHSIHDVVPGVNHLTIIEALADRESTLYQSMLALMRR